MNEELATHISLLAAPIYAAFLLDMAVEQKLPVREFPDDVTDALRGLAVEHAYALWIATRDRDK